MQDLQDVMCNEDPSAENPAIAVKKKYKLPEDPEAEASITIEGITTDELIDATFQGIDLVTYSGEYLSRTMLASYINSAIATAEQTFDIALTPRTVEDEVHDYESSRVTSYQHTMLFVRPVKNLIKVAYRMGTKEIMRVPDNWIQLDKTGGAFTIVPISGSIQPIAPIAGSTFPFYGSVDYLPGGMTVSYEAGMEKDEIPANLLEFIFKKASISVFEVWGDQIIGAGIASSSLSIDGLSQSIGTTQSAMHGGASARILEYRKDIEELTPIIRRHFARLNAVVL